ncbi:hypothetical protein LTR60_002082, partial [Cryomyces antarcticus]
RGRPCGPEARRGTSPIHWCCGTRSRSWPGARSWRRSGSARGRGRRGRGRRGVHARLSVPEPAARRERHGGVCPQARV